MGCSNSVTAANIEQIDSEKDLQERPRDFHDKYILGVKIGRGAFAQVRVATGVDDQPQKEKAVKILQIKQADNTEEENRKLRNVARIETNIWKTAGNAPNCVRLYDVMFGEDLSFMVMEKCDSGLYQAFQNMPDVTERGLGNIFAQMLLGIAHCHSVNIIHRDVKPDNFLVGGKNCDTVKLTDFGLSVMLKPLPNGQGKKSPGVTGVFGTAPFMSPEMLCGMWYDGKTDVWSFAALAYVLLIGRFPYMPKVQNSKAMKQAIIDNVPATNFKPMKPSGGGDICACTDVATDFLKAVLVRAATQRPTAKEALEMPWMVASLHGTHMTGVDLPSLWPVVLAAKRVGAFENRDLVLESPIDAMLSAAQMKRYGIPLPTATVISNFQRTRPSDPPQRPSKERKPSRAKDAFQAISGEKKADGKDWEEAESNFSTTCGTESNISDLDFQHERSFQCSRGTQGTLGALDLLGEISLPSSPTISPISSLKVQVHIGANH